MTLGPSIAQIQAAAARHYSVPREWIIGHEREAVKARRAAMYLSRTLPTREWKGSVKPRFSYPDLGRYFGGRDHTTVMCAIRTLKKRMKKDPKTRDAVLQIAIELRKALEA